jgi:hypothetical protein
MPTRSVLHTVRWQIPFATPVKRAARLRCFLLPRSQYQREFAAGNKRSDRALEVMRLEIETPKAAFPAEPL